MKKKSLAITITSVVLVVALVAVVALAISGVFSGKNGGETTAVSAEDASISNVAVLRNVATNKAFYVSSTRAITDINTFVEVRANGKVVKLKTVKADANGNVGFIKESGEWESGVSYIVSLKSKDLAFVEDQYKDMDSFIFIVDAAEAMDCEVSDKVVNLSKDSFAIDVKDTDENGLANSWTLIITGDDAKDYAKDTVFVYDDKLDVKDIDKDGELKSYAFKIDPNSDPTYKANEKTFMATVVNADIDDVFDVLNVHTNVGITEDSFIFNEEATINSIMNSDMFLSTVNYLYAEQLGSKNFKLGDYCSVVLDYNFKTGSPCYVTIDATLTFSGFLRSAKNASVVIKIANVLTPEFHGNFQKDPIAFDASLDLNVTTNVTVDGQFAYTFDNTDDNNNTEANTALKNVVNQVTALVSDALKSENKTEKSFIFATWVIPIGTTPIQVVESMGIEVKADLKAKIGASMKNEFNVELGVTYCDNKVTPIANVKDEFKIGTITLWGTLETKLGLYNEIGITACGVISVDLDVSVGAYCDVAGRLEMDGWEIMNGSFGLDPAYYIEAGIYLDMAISGKVLVFNIKKQTLLTKKWPLWSSGHKYIPSDSEANAEYTAEEDMYMNSSYFFFTTFKAYAIDIQNINDLGSVRDLGWDEFTYAYDSEYLMMVDNKVRVAATAPNEFDTYITVTSKVNKGWVKKIHVIKTPEAPTANNPAKSFEKGSNDALQYAVRLNSSKFIGISVSDAKITDDDYSYEDGILKIEAKYLNKLGYGNHNILFESSKGYLQLYVDIYSNKDIVPAGGFAVANFDKADPKNVEFDIDLLGNEIVEIQGLEQGQWIYSVSTSKLKILASALLDEEIGVQSYGISFSNGANASLNVKVADSRAPKMINRAYEYKLESGLDLDFDVEMYSNEITSLVIDNKPVSTAYVTESGDGIKAAYFNSYSAAKTIKGYFIAGGNKYDFTIELGKDNMLILPVKYVEFDKNSAKDVTLFASIPEGIGNIACVNGTLKQNVTAFEQGTDSVTIKADYLVGLQKGVYEFTLTSGADNQPTIIIAISNSTVPVMSTETIKITKGSSDTKKVAWDLADYTISDVTIEGLTEDQYTLTDKNLVLNVEALAYGETAFSVVTPVNAFDLTVVVDGSARWIQSTYTFRVADGEEMQLFADLAGNRLYDIKFIKDGKEMEIYNTQFRVNGNEITMSNDFAYNLAEGKYAVSLYVANGDKIAQDATLTVLGELKSYKAVTNCDGSEGNPWEIYTKGQFLAMIDDTNAKFASDSFDGVYFKLMADIDLGNATIKPISKFKGGFDGNGYTISNFKITDVSNDYSGLFAVNEGSIYDLRLTNVTVDVSKNGSVGIGLVAGKNTGSIRNVDVINGKINAVSKSWMGVDIQNAFFDIGGVVGYNEGSIKRCDCYVEINAEVKGLSVAGINIGGRKSCINVGAIVGYFKSGKVEKCDVTADVNAKAHNDSVTCNGWYGNSELSAQELEDSMRRCQVKVD